MEALTESSHRARLAAARVTETMNAGQRKEMAALPVHWKLVASHDALMSSVSHVAINCHRSAGRLYDQVRPVNVHRFRSLLGADGFIAG